MASAVDKFLEQWVASGLISQGEAVGYFSTLDPAPADERELVTAIVRDKKLTAFQAQVILKGKGRSLTLGNYHIQDELGKGGMGVVYKARHRVMKREVALKVLPAAVAKDSNLVERFHREVEAAARLNHPHVVAAYDADEAKGTHFFCMELVEGSDLSSYVKKRGVLPVSKAVDCTLQAARGLKYAHERGITHRDIKPGNLLLDKTGVVKVLDMGLARIEGEVGEQAQLTSTGAVMGTVDYMAPEQAVNTKDADARSDIYSLGITLWFLLTGKPAYEGTSLMARMLAHRDAPVPSLRAARQEVSEELNAVFHKMIAKNREDRYQSMGEVVTALEACLAGKSPSAPTLTSGTSEDSKLQHFFKNLGSDASAVSKTQAGQSRDVNPLTVSPNPGGPTQLDLDRFDPAPVNSDPDSPTLIAGNSSEITDPVTVTIGFDGAKLPPFKSRTKTSPPTTPHKRKLSKLALGAIAAVVLLGIILIIKSKDGKETRIEVAEGSGVQVDQQGNVVVTPPGVNPPEQPAPVTSEHALRFAPESVGFQLPEALAFDGSHSLTCEAWVKSETLPQEMRTMHLICHPLMQINYDLDLQRWSVMTGTQASPYIHAFGPNGVIHKEWTHVAAVLHEGEMKLFLNGQEHLSQALDGSRHNIDPKLKTFWIGDGPENGSGRFQGLIDEIRISKVARYQGDFTPVRRFTVDADTLALYHCEGESPDVLLDSTRNQFHAQIVKAEWVVGVTPRKVLVTDDITPPREEFMGGLQFDGVDDHVQIRTLEFREAPLTLEAWITPAAIRKEESSVVLGWKMNAMLALDMNEGPEALSLYGQVWLPDYADNYTPTQHWRHAFAWETRRHVAMVINEMDFTVYLDGVPSEPKPHAGLRTLRTDWAGLDHFALGAGISSHQQSPKTDRFFPGMIHAARVSKTARYSEKFVPTELVSDADTLALYKFDEGSSDVLKDTSGNGHDGKIIGATWVPFETLVTPLISPSGLSFDGIDDYIDLSALKLLAEDEITVDLVFSDIHNSGHNQLLFGFDQFDGSKRRAGRIQLQPDGTLHLMFVRDDQTTVETLPWLVRGGPHRLTVHWTKNGSTCWVDGTRQTTSTLEFGSKQSPFGYSVVGSLPDFSIDLRKYFLTGKIHTLCVSRGAISPEQGKVSFQSKSSKDTIALYDFTEGSGDVLKDISGNGHDGKIIGATWVGESVQLETASPLMSQNDVARWVIQRGGAVRLSGSYETINVLEKVPDEPIRITELEFRGPAPFTAEDAAKVGALPELTILKFNEVTLTKGALAPLAECRSLRDLLIAYSDTASEVYIELLALKKLQVLSLQYMDISDEAFIRLGELPQLRSINIVNANGLTQQSFIKLAKSPPPALQGISVFGTTFSHSGLTALSQFLHLDYLTLSNIEPVTDLESLQHCPTLSFLDISNVQGVRPEDVLALHNALQGCAILVSDPEIALPLNVSGYRAATEELCSSGLDVFARLHQEPGPGWFRANDLPIPSGAMTVNVVALPTFYDHDEKPLDDRQIELIAEIRDLRELLIGGLPPDGLSRLLPLKNLKLLRVNAAMTDSAFDQLSNFPKLNELGVDILNDESLKKVLSLPHLHTLIIGQESTLSDASLELLAQSPSLRQVDFTYANINEAKVQKFANNTPQIEVRQKQQEIRRQNDKDQASTWVQPKEPEVLLSDRQLAEWVIETGGMVKGMNGEEWFVASSVDQLPAGMPTLKVFTFFQAELSESDLQRFARLPELRELGFQETNITDQHLQALAGHPGLEALNLNSCAITDSAVELLGTIPKLSWLVLDGTPITDRGIAELAKRKPTLENLYLRGTGVTDAAVESLGTLTSLKELSLQRTKVTEVGVEKLKQTLPGCRIEWEGGANKMNDLDGWSFAKDREVAEWVLAQQGTVTVQLLDVSGNWITVKPGTALPEESFIVKLIDLRDGQVEGDDDLARLAQCRYLEELTAHAANFSSESLLRLAKLAQFRHLSIANHKTLKTSDLVLLKDAPGLATLYVTSEMVNDKLEFVRQLGQLSMLNVYGSNPPDISSLSGAVNLRAILLTTSDAVDETAMVAVKEKNPELRIIVGWEGKYRSIGKDAAQEAVQNLISQGAEVFGGKNYWQGRDKRLEASDFDSGQVWSFNLQKVPETVQLAEENLQWLRLIDSYHLVVEGQKNSDKLAQVLSEDRGYVTLTLTNCDLTDVGLEHLQKLTSLRSLFLRGTEVSKAGLEKLHHALPQTPSFQTLETLMPTM